MLVSRGRQWAVALANPAYAAAFALVVIQVVIGVIYKLAAQGGKSKSRYATNIQHAMTYAFTNNHPYQLLILPLRQRHHLRIH